MDIFEGPLDLLLHLIEKNEVSISDIPIASITSQYLETIETLRSFNLDIAGEYLVMATYLTHIKSQMLLPSPSVSDGGPADEEDPRAELVGHLLEYKRYKTIAADLGSMPLLGRDVFQKGLSDCGHPANGWRPPALDVNELFNSLKDLLERQEPEMLLEISNEPLSVREKIDEILKRLEKHSWLSFGLLFSDDFSRSNVVITLLAILEIVKMGLARIYQEVPFGCIVISRRL
ncbi:MAG: segregation and condensation protein A [Desulfomonilaceae bacterium]